MDKVLQIQCSGWTASPRLPYIISGNAICMHTPSYSMLLGLLGCCIGEIINPNEVSIGFYYEYDDVSTDIETRHRLQSKNGKVSIHSKGTDVYKREFHTFPKLTIWIDRLDWKEFILYPKGTPCIGASQDIVKIESVREINVKEVEKAEVSGTMLPFDLVLKSGNKAGGQLVQMAEYYIEADNVGEGRLPINSSTFIAIPYNSKAELNVSGEESCLYEIEEENTSKKQFYMHKFNKVN